MATVNEERVVARQSKNSVSSITLDEAVSVKTAPSGSRKKTVIRKEDVERVKNRLEEIWHDAPENAPFTDEDGELQGGLLFYVRR